MKTVSAKKGKKERPSLSEEKYKTKKEKAPVVFLENGETGENEGRLVLETLDDENEKASTTHKKREERGGAIISAKK